MIYDITNPSSMIIYAYLIKSEKPISPSSFDAEEWYSLRKSTDPSVVAMYPSSVSAT